MSEPMPDPVGSRPVPTFDLVRRGYDRAAVDAYFALPPESRPAQGAFDLVRRGYDRAQVDEAIRAGGTIGGTTEQVTRGSDEEPPRKRSWWR